MTQVDHGPDASDLNNPTGMDEHRFVERVCGLEAACGLAERDYNVANEKAKSRKKELGSAQARLRQFIQRWVTSEPLPLFDNTASTGGHAGPGSEDAAAEPDAPAGRLSVSCCADGPDAQTAAWVDHEHVSRCGCRAMNPKIQQRIKLARRK